ncbi:MAG TPA: NAD(P)-dependent oxidoreductase [Roseiflexaceae bacterium]|nr:NAD(P)-dependent oxidoreductase [Roseiflexaceae bacterium]
MERIGLAGLGRMGQALAGRLLSAGFPLAVYNRTRARAEALLGRGAAWAGTPAELAAQADIVLTILTDDRAVERVYLGPGGLLSGDVAGKLFVEMSTIRTATIAALRPAVERGGARLLDAPVSGTVEPARQGQLLTLVGGAEEDLERARPALAAFSRRIVHMGPSGAGTTMKLVLNMPMAVFWAALGEALAIGAQHGLPLDRMLDVFLDSPVALPALRAKAPLLLGAAHEPAFDVTGVRKDLLAMVATGQDVGVPTPTGAAALAQFAAATAAGYGERDLVFIVEYLAEVARRTFPIEQT